MHLFYNGGVILGVMMSDSFTTHTPHSALSTIMEKECANNLIDLSGIFCDRDHISKRNTGMSIVINGTRSRLLLNTLSPS